MKDAIEAVPPEYQGGGCYSCYFTVPKKDGGIRPILDLRNLNEWVLYKKIRMISIQIILPLLKQGIWMVTLDLKDTYFHISIAPAHRRFLRFTVGDNHYQFKVLPFGLASAPRIFTKVMVSVISHLHTLGINVFPYLEDWLFVADSKATLSQQVDLSLRLLHSLGIQVNLKKSHLVPTQDIVFIGASLDSTIARAFLPLDRVRAIEDLVRIVQAKRSLTALTIQKLLGHMAASIPVVPFAKLHMCLLQMVFLKNFNLQIQSQTRKIRIPRTIRDSLTWWLDQRNTLRGNPFSQMQPTCILTTDASLKGWGALMDTLCTQGRWSVEDNHQHINFLELKAIFLALRAFLPHLIGQTVVVRSDNTTAVSYINKQGGTASCTLCKMAITLWDLCIQCNIFIIVTRVPGMDNVLADSLSREHSEIHEW